jgi:hypothetical protein
VKTIGGAYAAGGRRIQAVDGHEACRHTGGFTSFPAVFVDAPRDLTDVIKMIHRPTVRDGTVGLDFATDAIVVDVSGVSADRINADAIAVDCDLSKRIALESPSELRSLVEEMQRGTPEGVQPALEIAHRIGLTEGAALSAGGGLLSIFVIIGLGLGAAGCGGALKGKASRRQRCPTCPSSQPSSSRGSARLVMVSAPSLCRSL